MFNLDLQQPDATEWLRIVMIRRLHSEAVLTMRLAHLADILTERLDDERENSPAW